MSHFCPLCGKTKPEDALFCDDCTKKIHTEYEVYIPDNGVDDDNFQDEPVFVEESEPATIVAKKKKRIGVPILILLTVGLLVGAFFAYNEVVRKGNLDRGGWDAAVKANSVAGYLAYMEAHPHGAHFEEAQAGLLQLKSEEAMSWVRMRGTDNVSELRDFLELHPQSAYAPLVKTRLDSLVWVGALQTNTPESYSDYIMLTENEGVEGGYIAEARKRYELLSRTEGADPATLDSIRVTVSGFFTALSALDHNRMVRFMAPAIARFFNSGPVSRERITGELLMAGAQRGGTTLQFTPDVESVRYEKSGDNRYKVNVPLRKSYTKEGNLTQVQGYIAHMDMDSIFHIVSIYETKPYPEAP